MAERWEPVPVPQGDGRHDIGDNVRAAIALRLTDDWSRRGDLSESQVHELSMWAAASVRALLHELGTLNDAAGQETSLQATVRHLEEENARLKKGYDAFRTDANIQRQRNSELDSAHKRLIAVHRANKASFTDLESTLRQHEAEIERLKAENETLEYGYADHRRLYREMRADRDRVQSSLAALASAVTSLIEGGYLQHKRGCEALQCVECKLWDDNHHMHGFTHDLVPTACTCGLDTLLATLTRARSQEEKLAAHVAKLLTDIPKPDQPTERDIAEEGQ